MAAFYTLEEAAGLLGMTAVELRQKARAGEVRGLLLGGNWMLRSTDVHDFGRRRGLALPGGTAIAATSTAIEPTPQPIQAAAAAPARHVAPVPAAAIASMNRDVAAIEVDDIVLPQPAAAPARAEAPRESPREQDVAETRAARSATLEKKAAEPEEGLIRDWPEPEAPKPKPKVRAVEPGAGPKWEDLLQAALASTPAEAEPSPDGDKKPDGSDAKPQGSGAGDAKSDASKASTPKPVGPAAARRSPTVTPAAATAGVIPVECPNPDCRSIGKVPNDRMDGSLKCAACGQRFYLDMTSGQASAGERPAAAPDQKPGAPGPSAKKKASRIEAAFDAWLALPQKTKTRQFVLVGILVVSAFAGVYFLWPSLPDNPRDRTQEVVKALARNEPRRLQAITLAPLKPVSDAWFKKVRPAGWPEYKDSAKATVKVIFSKKDSKKAIATTTIQFLAEDVPASLTPGETSNVPRGQRLTLFWEKNPGSEWLFNPASSIMALGEAAPPAPTGTGLDP